MARKATYQIMRVALCNLLEDLRILSGDKMGPSDIKGWQDVAGTAMVNAQVLASQLEQARLGNHESFIVFPSPDDCGGETE